MDKDFNFNDSYKYINDNKIKTDKIDELKQDKTLDSEIDNLKFNFIEENLNLLYEKTRLIQDGLKYINLHVKNEITNSINDLKSIVKSIEDNRDYIKNNSYVVSSVAIRDGSITGGVDRDGSSINKSSIINGCICPSDYQESQFFPFSTEFKTNSTNNLLENNIESMILSKSYRSLYMFSGIPTQNIEEEITIHFTEATTINHIELNLCNCKIASVKVRLLNDKIKEVNIDGAGYMNQVSIRSIYITIKAETYMVSQTDYRKEDGDFWSKINTISIDQNLYMDRDKYYYYLFGIDNIKLSKKVPNITSSFHSDYIKVGATKKSEYITIDTSDYIDDGSIEYYIIDGTTSIPILSEKETTVNDERIFFKMPLRFPFDASKPIKIKQNGYECNMTLQDAMNSNTQDKYTVSYTPIKAPVKIINNDIKIRAVIRTEFENNKVLINKIKVKKYGGGDLWTDSI